MTNLEYVISLQDQGVDETEIKRLVKQRKLDDKEVKIDVVADPKGAAVTTNQENVPNENLESVSENGSSDLASVDKNFFNTETGQAIVLNKAQPVSQGTSVAFGDTNYKYDVDIENNPVFFSKTIGSTEWTQAPIGSEQEAMIENRLGFYNERFKEETVPINFPTDDFSYEVDEEGREILPEVVLTPIKNNSVIKINNQIVTSDQIKQKIDTNALGFEEIKTVQEYVEKWGDKAEVIDSYEGSIDQDYDNYLNATKLTPEEEININNTVNDMDFTPYQQTIKSTGGSSLTGISSPTSRQVTIQPFKEELKKAKQIIDKEKKLKGDTSATTKEQLQGVARIIYEQELINPILNKKNKDYLKNLPKKKVKELFNHALKIRDSYEWENQEIDFMSQIFKLNNGQEVKNINAYETSLLTDAKELEKLKKENNVDLYNNKLKLYNDKVDFVNTNKQNFDIKKANLQIKIKDYISDKEDYENAEASLDFLKRNYSLFDKIFGDLSSIDKTKRYGTLQQGIMGLLGKSAYFTSTLLDKLASATLVDSDGKEIKNESSVTKFLKEGLQANQKIVEKRTSLFAKAIDFESINSFETFGYWLADTGTTQLPFFASIGFGGPLGWYLAATSSGGDYMTQRELEEINGGRPVSDFMLLQAIGFSGLEYIGGILPTLKILRQYRGSGGEARRKIGSGIREYFQQLKEGTPLFMQNVRNEIIGETAITQWGQNIIADRPMFENTLEVAFTSGMFGVTFAGAPLQYGAAMAALSDKVKYKKFTDGNAELKNITKALEAYDYNQELFAQGKLTGYSIDILSQEQVNAYKKRFGEITKKNIEILKEIESDVANNIDPLGWSLFMKATTRQENLRDQYDSLLKLEQTKEIKSLLAKIRIEFDKLADARNIYKKSFTSTYGLLEEDEKNRLEKIALSELKFEGKQSPSDSQVIDKAKKIRARELLEQNMQKDLLIVNKLNASGISTTYTTASNNSKLIQEYTKIIQARIDDPKNSTTEETGNQEIEDFAKGIKDGTINGSNFVSFQDGVKVFDVVVSIENATNNLLPNTGIHEALGHTIFSEAFGINPQAFKPFANTVMSFLRDFDVDAYNRILTRTNNQTPDEVLTVFLEEVAEGRIDLSNYKKTGLLGVLGLNLNDGVIEAGKLDVKPFNFRGETDIIKYLEGLAAKYKEGTITVEDIKDMTSSDVWDGEAFVNEEVVVTAKRSKTVIPEDTEAYMELDNDMLQQGLNDAIQNKTDQRFAIAQALTEKNWPLISKSLNINSEIEMNIAKEIVIDQLLGQFEGSGNGKYSPRITSPVTSFSLDPQGDTASAQVSTYLTETFRKRKPEIDLAIKERTSTAVQNESDLNNYQDIADETQTPSGFEARTGTLNPYKLLDKGTEKAVVYALEKFINKEGIKLSDLNLSNIKPYSEIAAQFLANKFGFRLDQITEPANNLSGDLTPFQLWAGSAGNINTIIKMISEGNRPLKDGGQGLKLPRNFQDAFYVKTGKKKNSIQYKLRDDITPEDIKKFFGILESGRVLDATSVIAQNIKGFLDMYSRYLTIDAVGTIVENKIEEGIIEPGEGASIIDAAKAGSSRSMRSITTADIKKIAKEGIDFMPREDINSSFNYKKSNGNIEVRKRFDENKPKSIQLIKDIKSFLKEFPLNAPHFKTGMTGTESTHTFGKVPTFKRLFPGFDYKNPIPRTSYTGDRILISSAIQGLELKNEAKLLALKQIFLDIQSFLASKKGKGKEYIFEEWLRNGSQDQNHPLRFLAPFVFYSIDPVTGKISRLPNTEEHSMPAVQVGRMLFAAAKVGEVDRIFKVVRKTYMQGGLLRSNDLDLAKFNLEYDMPDVYWDKTVQAILDGKLDFLPDGYASIIRYTTNNVINPFALKVAGKQETIGEYFVGKPTSLNTLTGRSKLIGIEINKIKANELITSILSGDLSLKDAKAQFKIYQNLVNDKVDAFINLENTFGNKVGEGTSIAERIEILNNYDIASRNAKDPNAEPQGISVLDFDDTVGITNSKIVVTMPGGEIIKINATDFALKHEALLDIGAKFNFTQFNRVVGGKKGPLFDKLKKAVDKFGNKNVFILTARPQAAAPAIHAWLKSEGLVLLENNIIGLENGAPQAKANWIVSKAAEGYNDFYFADDAIKNVNAVKQVLDALDIKGKTVVALRSKQANFTTIINDIIENKTGIESYKTYSAAKAQTIGATKGKYNWYIPPSAEDFTGLLYKMLGKGSVGDAQMAFFKDNLIDPYNRAEIEISAAKNAISADFNALKSRFPTLPTSLKTQTGIGLFDYQHAIRTYIWNSQGIKVPELSIKDQKRLVDFVKSNPELKVFSDELILLQKGKPYPSPSKGWVAGTISTDIINGINKVNRKEYLQEWQENVDIIFSEEIMNKLQAAFGNDYVKALKSSLSSMQRGSNRSSSSDSITTAWYDWINNSVGVVMFLNTRSALLQMISNVNFVNWSDNNPLKAAKAFADQPQYWKDVTFLMNSHYLKDRRVGLKINISESEIADLAKTKGNKTQAFIALALNKGFVFTRYADSFAIATGGATYYRNRLNDLLKSGMDQKAAEKQAFEDFYTIAETSQQSSNAAMVSDQQRSAAGRLILSFGNTQMQYARIQKKAILDLVNRRGNDKENLSKLVYYSTIQNLMFNALTQGIQFLLFDGNDEDKEGTTQAKREERIQRTLNGMFDSQVRGLGIGGAMTVTLKNTLMTIAEEMGKKSPEYKKAVDDLFSISPPIQSKLRKLNSAANTFSWNSKEMKENGIHINNPAYLAVAQIISATSNVPIDEALMKVNALRAVYSDSSEKWQKVAVLLGWSTWDVGLPYYGVDDKIVMTPEMKIEEEINVMKKETTTKEQKQTLLDLGLTKKEILKLRYEDNRVRKIYELTNKPPYIKN